MKKIAAYYISIAIAVFLIALGLYEDDTVVTMYAAIALVLYAVLLYCSRDRLVDPRAPLLSAVVMMVMSFVLLYVLNLSLIHI